MGDWGTASDKHSTSSTTRLHTIAGVHAQVLHIFFTQPHTNWEIAKSPPGNSWYLWSVGAFCEIMITLRPDQSFNSRSCAAKRSPKAKRKDAQGKRQTLRRADESRWEPQVKQDQRWSKMVDGQSVPWPEEGAEGAEGAASVERCSGPAVHCRSKRLGQAFAPAAKRLLLTGPGPEKFDTNQNSNPN